MILKSLFIIFFIIFCMTQANSAQKCPEAFFLKKAVTSDFLPIIPMVIDAGWSRPLRTKGVIKPVEPVEPIIPTIIGVELSKGNRQFRTAYNKGKFVGDERYISKLVSFGRKPLGRKSLRYSHYRITGLENGNLIVDYINHQTGSIRSTQIRYETNALHVYAVTEQSKKMFHRVEQSPPLTEVNFDSKNTKKLKENKIDRAIFIGNGLRNSPTLNPYTTHIVDFKDQITDHVEYIKQGILSSGTDVNSKLTILDALKHEAESSKLTYQYWLLWNMRLSILVSSEKPTSWNWRTHEGTLLRKLGDDFSYNYLFNDYTQDIINSFLALFPSFIILPVIGSLEYKDFNKTTPYTVIPIQLENKDIIQDNMEMSPYNLYEHDMNHAILNVYKRIDRPKMTDGQFIKRYLQIAELFPDKIREMAEIGFFIFFHETSGILEHGSNIKEFFENNYLGKQNIYTSLRNKENNLGSILPADIQSDRAIKEYFEQVTDVFNTIYLKIL